MMYHIRLGAIWVLLAAAAALELYDELPRELNTGLLYRDANDADTGLFRQDDTEATRLNTRKDMPTGDVLRRFEDERDGESESTTMKRPGSNRVCYFKICKPGK